MGLVDCFQKQQANYLHVMDETQGAARGGLAEPAASLAVCRAALAGRVSSSWRNSPFASTLVSFGGSGQGRTPLRERNLETDLAEIPKCHSTVHTQPALRAKVKGGQARPG